MLWEITLVMLIVWFMVLRWQGRHIRQATKQIKSDLGSLPFIGHAHHFLGGGEVRMSVIQHLSTEATTKHNGWVSLQLGPAYYGVVTDAVDSDYVMRVHLEKNDVLKVSANLIGNGLIFAPVSIWRPRRKVLAPTFSQYNLNQFVNVFYKQSCVMVDNLKEMADKKTFSIWKYVTSYTMDSICQTTLGSNIGVQKTADHPFLQYFQTYADLTSQRLFSPWLHSETHFKYLSYFGMYAKCAECIKYLKGFVFDIIDKKRAALKTSEPPNNNKENGYRPIMELLIEASGGDTGYSNEELQEEAQVILVAGTDTSAVGTAFVAMMLSKHPDIQEKVYKEIYALYGDSDRPIVAEDLNHLSYLEIVIKETLRLYPPVPVTARKIVKDDVTPSGTKLLAGMGVIISHWGLHRNENYWGKDVEEFRPERFIDSPPTHPGAYIPFGSGPRNCLGYKYAMMSMMTATATLLRKYRILPFDQEEVGKPLRLKYEIMMKHIDDFLLKLEPRK